ncbi:MAG: hypothetical protein RLZ10_707 [Bacteroidota bacterium]|jgi:hypothetical protein
MDNEFDDATAREFEEFKQFVSNKIREMAIIKQMCENAPQDGNGNAVVDIIGVRNFGLFYVFLN